jgi:hypothetical protein
MRTFTKTLMAFALIGFLMSSCGGGSEICNCVDLSVKALKEMKAVNFDKEKCKKINDTYKPKVDKCEESYKKMMEGKTDEEKKKLQEEAEKCPGAKEIEPLMQEMMSKVLEQEGPLKEGE